MKKYLVISIKNIEEKNWFAIYDTTKNSIMLEPTKYLKHKVRERCSPNTIKHIAYSLSYYFHFLEEMGISIEQVLKMKYAEQHEHFVGFLIWLKDGGHCERTKVPNNATCNSYLQAVFGYYEFLSFQFEYIDDLKVLENRNINYSSGQGVRFSRRVKSFRGYLREEHTQGKTIPEENIKKLLEASDSTRNKLLILLLAETGFRIGEVLGIKYTEDIDFTKGIISITYRENNENEARAKNAEIRSARISNETLEILEFYISENRRILAKSEYLFINLYGKQKGKPLNANAVYSALGLLEKKTGIKVTPHMLRHYYANERRKSGWSIDKISASLGHKHIATTEHYMNIESAEMSEAMEKYYEENAGLYDISKII